MKKHTMPNRSACLVALCAVIVSVSSSTLLAQRQVVDGHIPPVAAQLQPIGRMLPSEKLQLAIGLPLVNQSGLSLLLQEIYDPASTLYHRYLSPNEFANQFGPNESDYAKLIAFVEANGLTVTGTYSNRMLLDVSGAVADIERVFHMKMNFYHDPKEDRTFYAPDADPVLEFGVSILDVSGLENYTRAVPLFRIKPGNEQGPEPLAGSGPSGSYAGNDFRAAYAPGIGLTGTGQSVGLLEFDGYTANDITYYEATNGLPQVPTQNVLLDGADGGPARE